MRERYLGVDVGAETIAVVELARGPAEGALTLGRRVLIEHHKEPERALTTLLADWRWDEICGGAACGRFSRSLRLTRVPEKQARAAGYRFCFPQGGPVTLISIGSHGFSVLELRSPEVEIFRENSRCSQGTGNFLRQLVERFDLSVAEAAELCAEVADPAPLSGRCPVILKTDMTHLANRGEARARILAGLFDAVAENVEVLIKPKLSPAQVMLLGGVSRSVRIREHFRAFLGRHGMTLEPLGEDEALFMDATGCAALAAEQPAASPLPALEALAERRPAAVLETVPALAEALPRVRRMPPVPVEPGSAAEGGLVVGLDMGSTGSKAVALEAGSQAVRWQGYVNTNGDPVGAARSLMAELAGSEAGRRDIVAFGVTGSGREIVGSLMATCYGSDRVFVLNEIAAHAAGALHFDARVDTIFEIGGQDAKYIRLAEGRVVDAAMNEACSAGTGSFIEEQGRRFSGIEDVRQLGREALAAGSGISLGQHCSVFMAEIIDEAVAAGIERERIIAGIYDSVVQNYLNRVKGTRSVGDVIFCQGMPFSADALAAAVARQTGSEVVVPPSPGTIGALGIALLTCRELLAERPAPAAGREAEAAPPARAQAALDLQRFLGAGVARRDSFVCKSKRGCGGGGNKCKIDRLTTVVAGRRQRFTWGGGCSLHERGTAKVKLPDGAPDPFREREELVDHLIAELSGNGFSSRGRIAITDEFVLKELFPFFATYLRWLGFELLIHRGADQAVLKRGIESANVPFCAPMQQFHGLVSVMAAQKPAFLFLPMVRSLAPSDSEPRAVLCPIVQASPDMLRCDLEALGLGGCRIASPVIDVGPEGLSSPIFRDSCARLAELLGVARTEAEEQAFRRALGVQERFDRQRLELGRRALAFCAEGAIIPVVVLGRSYTIYNKVLNSNVPALLREQGAIAIPVDCYPTDERVPVFEDIYWSYAQRNLRAAHQLRRTPRVYSLWCSNYACGPDSFCLHFYAYQMEGKPYAIIETDGHSGDAGTKTRIEAFLYCAREDLGRRRQPARPKMLKLVELDKEQLVDIRRRGERVLIPRMGPGAESFAACLRGVGIPAEALPQADAEALRIGRRHSSGKECVPLTITLGSLLQRLEGEQDSDELFSFFMPTAGGPCRFGVYNLLHKITLERLGFKDRVRVWSPVDDDYFRGVERGFAALLFIGFMAEDLLLEALYDVRCVEARPGAAKEIYEEAVAELRALLERAGGGDLSIPRVLGEVASGQLFGAAELLARTAERLRAVKTAAAVPTVLVVGEIYVRCDVFANDFAIDRLQEQGIRVRFAPFNEWLEYTDHLAQEKGDMRRSLGTWLSSRLQSQIQKRSYDLVAGPLGWPRRTKVTESLEAAAPYLRSDLNGEAVLTLGGPVHEHHAGLIDGALSLGPLECMPSKIAEAQLFHAAEREGLLSLTLSLNGDPVDPELFDSFVFEVKSRFRARRRAHANGNGNGQSRRLFALAASSRRLFARAPEWLQQLAAPQPEHAPGQSK